MIDPVEEKYLEDVARRHGYFFLHWIEGELWAIRRLFYTHAVIGEINECSYSKRYCYHTANEAITALALFDGFEEPTGWHKALVVGHHDRRDNGDGPYCDL